MKASGVLLLNLLNGIKLMREDDELGYVTYNQAQELKILGYQQTPEVWYRLLPKTDIEHYQGKDYKLCSIHNSEHISLEDHLAPTLDVAIDWLERKYKLLTEIILGEEGFDFIIYNVFFVNIPDGGMILFTKEAKESCNSEGYFNDDDAKLACLQQLIEIVKNQQ